MKKVISLCFAVIIILGLAGCNKEKQTSVPNNSSNSVKNEDLKSRYPEYFEMSDSKGIEVYVWQMAENSYRCGMMSGTNRNKTDEEILNLQFKSLSIEDAKAILAELGVEKEKIFVIPISQSYSSYYYEVNDEYREKATKLFD